MKRLCLILLIAVLTGVAAFAAPVRVALSGKVTDAASGDPLAGVVISVGSDYLWAVTDADGCYAVEGIAPGTYQITASCLGYVDTSLSLKLERDTDGCNLTLSESSLALDEVVVTAQRSEGLGTSHNLGRDALNHMQMSGLSDMSALLPGGKTVNSDLTSSTAFSLRSGGSSAGNAAFGTAVEVDGVRVGNNAGFAEPSGVDTRSISVDNIESVEVITGVPSAEYGDLNSGMVRIHTKKGRTPLNMSFSVNPRTYQASVSNGIGLGEGTLNLSAEWARATKKLTSPYESYTRRGLSLLYSNTFADNLRFEAGLSGNLGGMNSEDDPDAFSGEYTRVNDNVLRANTALTWTLNKPWITNLKFDASLSYNDNKSHTHAYSSSASMQPSVHSEEEGYSLAERLPLSYYSDKIVDSRELDAAASLKYSLTSHIGAATSKLKAGLQWKTNGNAGDGEYYLDPTLAANGYRPRPYSQYPFMHNLSLYAEDEFSAPVGPTTVELSAGLRAENVYIKGTRYDDMNTLSPRFNAKWKLAKNLSIRGGWGVTEKLPSFYILYPKQEYRDIRTFGFTHGDGITSTYLYYTIPYTTEYNSGLKWQRNTNSEVGIDFELAGVSVSLVGFRNVTHLPYKLSNSYTPFEYTILQVPSDYTMPADPQIKYDSQTGEMFVRATSDDYWTQMDVKVIDRSFVKTTRQDNGADVLRTGAELTVDFPEIKPLRTSLRLDASFAYTYNKDTGDNAYYNNGWSHTSEANRSYQYVGIYSNGGGSTLMICGKKTADLDANLTSITHIPEARLIITCRLEMSLLKRSISLATGGTDKLYPTSYLDLDGQIHEFDPATQGDSDEFKYLVLTPGNDYMFNQDGYKPYASANLSVTKEIGDRVSLSFFANNFTNSRPTVYSMATGVGTIFTPSFYYGLTCRLKLAAK